jgi:hypothetical protein
MKRDTQARLTAILRQLLENPAARIIAGGPGGNAPTSTGSATLRISEDFLRALLAQGLIEESEPGRYAASDVVHQWNRRRQGGAEAFRAQHHMLATAQPRGEARQALTDLDESPIATLARRTGKDGTAFLSPDLITAAERLRRDFEIGRLQPRVTANWSASVNRGRRTGEIGGAQDLTEMALSARRRVERAMEAVGPELSGILIDVCCFLKGLEMVERERCWPARSAKLVLRIALQTLARHYGLQPLARGETKGKGKVSHWGAEDYRPTIA